MKKLSILVISMVMPLMGLADQNLINVTVTNQYIFGSAVKLVADSYFPKNKDYYCPGPWQTPTILTSGSFNYGYCGQQQKELKAPWSPEVTYAIYPKDATQPVLTCKVQYSQCQATATPIPAGSSNINAASCDATATSAENGSCSITLNFRIKK